MTVTFFSNFLTHHQLLFCIALDRLTDGNFTFVSTMPISQERLRMGFPDLNKQYPFVLTTYSNSFNKQLAQKLAVNSDIVIIGSAPDCYMIERLKQNKLTFRYNERFYKAGLSIKRFPRILASAWLHHGRFMNRPLYMLCASAYTAADGALFGNYIGRTYKWGYFPEVKEQDLDKLFALKRKNKEVSLLWVGRLIGWKHPETPVFLAEKFKKNGFNFTLNLIGNGAMEHQLHRMIREKGLEDCVHMLGSMSPESVRDYMDKADIFLFTSDFNEGWGAVLNESMNSACAVVASHAIGSVPFLLEHGKNGFIYRNGNDDDLYLRVVSLIKDQDLRETMGKNAYQTLADQWNADEAARRFLELSQALLDGKSTDLFEKGPCSRASVIKNNWF